MPHNKRATRHKAWAKVFVSYLEMVNGQLNHFRSATLVDANMTPQVVYLERYLNSRYGTTAIRIIVGYETGVWEYPVAVTGEQHYDDPLVYEFSGNDETVIAFQVEVPNSLILSRPSAAGEIMAMVSRFKVPGKIFVLKIV